MIYPTITCINGQHFQKLKEAKKLGLEEICVFPTTLPLKERIALYQELKKSSIKTIPLVHLRTDMESWELKFFMVNFKTRVFNLHPPSLKYPLVHDLSRYRKRIYIENAFTSLDVFPENLVKEYAGICLDFSHLEGDRLLYQDAYNENVKVIEKYPCGCAHVSVIKKKSTWEPDNKRYENDSHDFRDFSELDYLRGYPKRYFPEIIAIELENPLWEQLEVKEYLQALLYNLSS